MRIVSFIFIFCFLTMQLFAQNADSVISTHVKDFFFSLDILTKYYNQSSGFTKTFSDEEVSQITKKYYKAIKEDPIGYFTYGLKEHNKFRSEHSRNQPHDKNALSLSMKNAALKSIIEGKFGEEIYRIIGIPYFLRVKVKDITQSIYISKTNNMKFGQTNLLCEIEDVVKGTNRFKKGDVVTITFLNWWMNECKNIFEVNQSYFTPLRVSKCNLDTCPEVALQILPDNNCGIYPIVNESVQMPNDYFKLGEVTQWMYLKKGFIKNYLTKFEEGEK